MMRVDICEAGGISAARSTQMVCGHSARQASYSLRVLALCRPPTTIMRSQAMASSRAACAARALPRRWSSKIRLGNPCPQGWQQRLPALHGRVVWLATNARGKGGRAATSSGGIHGVYRPLAPSRCAAAPRDAHRRPPAPRAAPRRCRRPRAHAARARGRRCNPHSPRRFHGRRKAPGAQPHGCAGSAGRRGRPPPAQPPARPAAANGW